MFAATWADDAEGALGVDGKDRPSLTDRLQAVCVTATDELDLHGTTITVMTDGADAPAASSSAAVRTLDDLQFTLGEGPSREAYAAGQPVLVSRLAAAHSRWPGFAAEASEVGAVFAFPLQLGATRFGVLTAYSRDERFLTRHEAAVLIAHAETATDLLLHGPERDLGTGTASEVLGALDIRSEVFQAQGMVAVALGVGLVEALARMRARAFRESLDLNAMAALIVEGYQLADDPAPPVGPGDA